MDTNCTLRISDYKLCRFEIAFSYKSYKFSCKKRTSRAHFVKNVSRCRPPEPTWALSNRISPPNLCLSCQEGSTYLGRKVAGIPPPDGGRTGGFCKSYHTKNLLITFATLHDLTFTFWYNSRQSFQSIWKLLFLELRVK